ncbi:MAG: hypothetical protein NVSMB49_22110 [Ktedonobacteraceae bacterium]
MTDTQMNKASWEFVDSLHETNRAVADHYVAVQDRNLQFAQNLFLLGAEAMESQTKTTRHLINQWTHQLPKQQKAFYGLMNATLDVYLDFLRLPFSSYQTVVNTIEGATQRTLQFTHYMAQQTIEAAGTVAHREQAQLWTFEHQLEEADNQRPVLIQAKGPGMVHAGVNRAGKWIRMYDMPLQEVSLGVWEAVLQDPEVNEFTFIWYDPDRSGSVHWEGKNYLLPRRPISKEEAEWPMEKSIKNYLAQTEVI